MLNRKNVIACCIVTVAAMAVIGAAHAADHREGMPVDAIWKAQTLVFDYRSAERHYRCDILEHKIKTILHRLGAHERMQVRRAACHGLAGRARFEVTMQSPVEATPDNVRAVTHYDARDELIARIHDVTLPSENDLERFQAVWSMRSFRKLDLDAGDCALVQQIRRQIIPRMSVDVVKDIRGVDCAHELTSIGGPPLTVIALVPSSASERTPARAD